MDVIEYADSLQEWFSMYEMESFGYETKTTFYMDISIAECYGIEYIKKSYNDIIESWMDDYKFIAEFILVLNTKAWEWDARRSKGLNIPEGIVGVYSDLFYDLKDKVFDHYKDNEEATNYIFKLID